VKEDALAMDALGAKQVRRYRGGMFRPQRSF
jgi:hypothetical protein